MSDTTQVQANPPMPSGTLMQTPSQASLSLEHMTEPYAPDLPPGYERLRELGRGGMGVVYHARQAHLNRTVAVKMLLCGDHCSLAEVQRFVTEGEAVARVRHPNVVQVYDAGRFRGIPFVAMEYVAGGPLSARLTDGPLPPDAAARLMWQVANGVAACHAAGILHRDLKPANILLADPADGDPNAATVEFTAGSQAVLKLPAGEMVPKVADFGLAKRVGSDGPTVSGAMMGTPCYMAPEQARGEAVGPPADVYSLGAVLYEFLTGRPPFAGPDGLEVLRRAREEEPLPVRALQPGVPRDVETICMKCLAKDPARRYPTAAALAEDLRRWREGEAITARPAGRLERAGRWARRNRPVTMSAAAVFAALLLGTAVSLRQAADAVEARQDAEQAAARAMLAAETADRERAKAKAAEAAAVAERQTAEAVAHFLADVMEEGSPRRQRHGQPARTVGDALRYAAATIGTRFPGRPDLEAAVRGAVGDAFTDLGEYAQAEPQLVAALELARKAFGDDHPRTLTAARHLGRLYHLTGRREEAEKLLKRAADGHRGALGDRHPEALSSLSALASLYFDWRRLSAAEPLLRENVAGQRATRPGQPGTFRAAGNLGVLLMQTNKLDEAAPLLTEAADGLAATLGPDHPDTLMFQMNLGELHLTAGRLDEAARLLSAARDGLRAVLGPDHPDFLTAAVALGNCLMARKKPAEAIPALAEATAGLRKKLGATHADSLWAAGNLGTALVRAGRDADAVPVLERLVADLRTFGDSETEAERRVQLARALTRLKRYPEAEGELGKAVEEMRRRPANPTRLGVLRQAAAAGLLLYADWGQPAKAAAWRAKLADVLPPREPAPVPRRVRG